MRPNSKLETTRREDDTVKGGDESEQTHRDQQVIKQVAAAHHFFPAPAAAEPGSAAIGIVDHGFPTGYTDGAGKVEQAEDDEGEDGGTKTEQQSPFGIDGFFGHIGYAFDGEKNQMAKGVAAKAPDQPFGKAAWVRFFHSKCGSVTPANNNSSSPTASSVISSSNVAAAFTP